MFQYITAGESHGAYLTAILEGMPSGLVLDEEFIQRELWRRQQGYGRGGRQKIEKDEVKLTSGIYQGKTTGAPIGFLLANKDVTIDKLPQLFRPRPGHADLAGSLKYQEGIREILERASARETVMRVAVGAAAKLFLREFGIWVASHVVQIGEARLDDRDVSIEEIAEKTKNSPVGCVSEKVEEQMIAAIDQAIKNNDSLGGVFEVRAKGVPVGLGSHVDYRRKLDGRIAQGLMSLQSVKGVAFGLGFRLAGIFGSEAHDEIVYSKERGYHHLTNRAGGIEGGMSNGEEIVVRATMKPISTLRRALRSVNMKTKSEE
ncbi:MAG: chorismate synthase, partial [Candidatus Omnitrophica bacterium]|nr:chorismate synthase [Candidatus Omnitrophota bacterium]